MESGGLSLQIVVSEGSSLCILAGHAGKGWSLRLRRFVSLLFGVPETSCDVLNDRSWLFLVRKPCRRIFVGLWKIGCTENHVPERKHEGEILAPMAFVD